MTVELRVPSEDVLQIMRQSSTATCTHLHTGSWLQELDAREEDELGIDSITMRWHYFRQNDEVLRVKEVQVVFRGACYQSPVFTQHSISCEVVDRVKFLFETITEEKIRALIESGDQQTLNVLWGKH